MSTAHKKNSGTDDSYIELVLKFRLKQITTDAELNEAVEVVDGLIDCDSLDSGQQDYLDVLSDLIHAYESSQHPIGAGADGEVLRLLMDTNELSQKRFATEVEIAESVVSEILSGKRELNRKQIDSVCHRFSINSNVFHGKQAS